MVEISKIRAYKTIQTPSSASLLPNNLSTVDGIRFLVVKNTEKGGQISLYTDDVTSNKIESATPEKVIIPTTDDCLSAKFVKFNKQLLAVICSFKSLLIFNDSLTEQLFKFDLPTQSEWFTCASIAYCADSSEERIAIGTSKGNIFIVFVGDGVFKQVSGF